jgi:hypothetical protein
MTEKHTITVECITADDMSLRDVERALEPFIEDLLQTDRFIDISVQSANSLEEGDISRLLSMIEVLDDEKIESAEDAIDQLVED